MVDCKIRNAGLQCLFNEPHLASYLFHKKHIDEINPNESGALVKSFAKILQKTRTKSSKQDSDLELLVSELKDYVGIEIQCYFLIL